MWRVCIADDERYVLKSIAQRIELSGLPFEITGTAGNGVEAYSLYERQKPDVFFVDINMPVISGLDFIEKIKRQDPQVKTRFVIISGYDDFAYMQKAILLGVVNYIKKPISAEEFSNMLEGLCAQLDESGREKRSGRLTMAWADFLRERHHSPEGAWLCVRMSQGRDPEDAVEQINAQTGANWKGIRFFGVSEVLLLFEKGAFYSGRQLDEMAERDCMKDAVQIVYYMGKCKNPEKLASDFEDMLNIRFYHPEYRLMRLREEKEQMNISLDKVEEAMEGGRESILLETIKELLESVLTKEERFGGIRQVYQAVVLMLANKYAQYGFALPSGLRQELFPFATSVFKDSRQLEQKLADYSADLCGRCREYASRSELTERAVTYMRQHYREQISLSDIASELYVVPTYLAKRFKERKNCTVLQYLEEIRMKKAKELLENSELSVTEIAQSVGFSDPNYFTRSFGKCYDISPREYRKERSVQSERKDCASSVEKLY